jgi:hypothetical protein
VDKEKPIALRPAAAMNSRRVGSFDVTSFLSFSADLFSLFLYLLR